MAEKTGEEKTIPDELLGMLRMLSPGKPLRTAIDEISKAGTGALIFVCDLNDDGVKKVISGGFEVNCDFSAQRLVELCKMDGAVAIDKNCKKILLANILLVPESSVKTSETGTRHQAAERTAKQTKNLTIAISEKKKIIKLYCGDIRYVLRDSQELLSRAGEESRMLEKQKEMFSELLLKLNILEFTNLPSLNEAVLAIQRVEIMARIAAIIKTYIVELGKEGALVKMHLKELMRGVEDEEIQILKDYSKRDVFATKVDLVDLPLEDMVEVNNILEILGYWRDENTENVTAKGYRILNKTTLTEDESTDLIKKFGNLQEVINAPMDSLVSNKIDENKSFILQKQLSKIREDVMLGKVI